MRTESAGGSWPSFKNRRMLLYDAVSTSIEKVERASSATAMNSFSAM
jgi:hypothetical protein